ncbi:MAG: VTT domain-containing protein [Oscillospiraceae bacterium]
MNDNFLNKIKDKPLSKFYLVLALVISSAIFISLGYFLGKPILEFVGDSKLFRQWVGENKVLSRVAFVAMMCLQVVIAIIPGEPLEISAGYAFGAVEGTVLCLIGTLLGSFIIFGIVRALGVKILRVFFKQEDIDKISFLRKHKNLNLLVFIIFSIPGSPKDLLSYFIGLTKMKLFHWLGISTIARIPSVITSTIGGSAIGGQNYSFAFWVFALTGLISLIGLASYNIILKHNSSDV